MSEPRERAWTAPKAAAPSFDEALKAEGVTGQLADIARSIYQQESGGGRNTKTSNAGAVGGMQIIPATFASVADQGWDINDAGHNMRAGIRYVRQMHERAGGDPALTAAGYYGGPGGLDKARRGVAVSDPRNPNAPTTLQYGQQVAARLPRSPIMQGIEAMTNAIVPSAQAAQEPNPWERDWAEAPPAAQTEQPSALSRFAQGFGVGTRGLVLGLVSAPGIVTDAATGLVNEGLDLYHEKRAPTMSELVTGKQKGFRFQTLRSAANNLMNAAGMPDAQNGFQRIARDVTEGAASGLSFAGMGGVLSRAAGALPKAVGQIMAAGPGLQVASGAAGAGASSATREAGGGEVAQTIAGLVGGMAVPAAAAGRMAVPAAAAGRKAAPPSQSLDAAKRAQSSGYVIPPADIAPGEILGEMLGGLSGKIKTAQVASARNQVRTNELIRREIGLPDGVDLTPDTLQGLRNEAAKAYGAVAGTGTVVPGTKYAADLDKAIDPFLKMARSFPGRPMPAVVNDIQSLKTAAFDADDALQTIRVLRSDADAAYRAGDNLAGKAYKAAAGTLEDALGSHLKTIGAPKDVLDNFRAARQAIAKTYTVQSALQGDGSVSAVKLAGQLARGKPLSGEIRNIAEIAGAFPRATQALRESPKALSPLDFVAPSILTGTTGNVASMVTTAARPVARTVALSGPMQKYAIRKAGQGAREAAPGTAASNAMTLARAGQPSAQPAAADASEPMQLPAGMEGPWQMDWGGADATPASVDAGAVPTSEPAPSATAPEPMAAPDAPRVVNEAGEALDPTEPEVREQLQEEMGGEPVAAAAPRPPAEITQPLEPVALSNAGPVAAVEADGGEEWAVAQAPEPPASAGALEQQGVMPGDILNPRQQPFTNRYSALQAAARAGEGYEAVPVDGGFVVRQTAVA